MKKLVLEAAAVLAVAVVALLAIEGAWSLIRWKVPHESVTYAAVRWVNAQVTGKYLRDDEQLPGVLTDAAELEALLPLLVEQGVAMGNVPYAELDTARSRMNTVVDGCYALQPNLDKTVFHLRTLLFNPLDPISVFYDTGTVLDPALQAFFAEYGLPPVRLTSNVNGERTTLPLVERDRKVLVAGDSVAFGAMIGDADTLASQLQLLDPERQYISTAVGGADARDVICNLERAAARYAGAIDALVYVYCENDFNRSLDFGEPEPVIDWLADFAAANGLEPDRVTIVYAPTIYNIVPQFTRFAGYRGFDTATYLDQRQRLEAAVGGAGFRWLDIATLVQEENAEFGTQFATLRYFVDHLHLSPWGMRRLAQRLHGS